mgnify:CR=1 FL=1
MKSCHNAQSHTGGLYRLCKEAVDKITKDLLQAEGNASWSASYATGQVNKQRMGTIYNNIHDIQLLFQTSGSGSIA